MVSTLLKQVRRFKPPQSQPTNCRPAPAVSALKPSRYVGGKYILDYFIAALLLVPGLPLMALFACLVRLTSRGPAIFTQTRVGHKGRIFKMFKIRSMTHNAEARTGPAWTQTADPRVTPLGRFMRKFHFDELPQLFNVLRGEMSLVGPRPERPEFVKILSRRIPDYANRHAVKPGITGLAQLNLPPDSDLDSVRRKIMLDLEYIQTATLWLDLRLLLCTALRIAKLPVLGIFGLKRAAKLPAEEDAKSAFQPAEAVVTLKQFQMQLESNPSNANGAKSRGVKAYDPRKCKQTLSK
ncbi:MAG: sugar transferase [Pirellulales bacterium]|nr:sugar transferase [Pirellulales bacterium]